LTITIELDLDTARPTARAIQSRLSRLGHEVSLGTAYEILAAVAHEPEWNVLSAKLKKAGNAPAKTDARPSACVIIDLIEPTDPSHYKDTYGITPDMLVQAAEAFLNAYYQDPNPTAEVIRENFSEYMSDLIAGNRRVPQPGWIEGWRANRGSRPRP
jgi:hypothetical protein